MGSYRDHRVRERTHSHSLEPEMLSESLFSPHSRLQMAFVSINGLVEFGESQ